MPSLELGYKLQDGAEHVYIRLPKPYAKDKCDELLKAIEKEMEINLSSTDIIVSADGGCVIKCGSKYPYWTYEGIISNVLKDEAYIMRFTNLKVLHENDREEDLPKIGKMRLRRY